MTPSKAPCPNCGTTDWTMRLTIGTLDACNTCARPAAAPALREEQDVDVNYYVLVPFTTFRAAEWAAGQIGVTFDCHVVSVAAVNQDALVLASVTDGDSDVR